MKRRDFMRLAGSAAVWPLTANAQDAANYPSRPVTVVVPYAAGGGLDLIARVLAQKLTERTGQSFFVEIGSAREALLLPTTSPRRLRTATPY